MNARITRVKLALALVCTVPAAAVAVPVVTVSSEAPAAVAQARPGGEVEMDKSYAGPGRRKGTSVRHESSLVSFAMAGLGAVYVVGTVLVGG
jgi:hypothetical protein